MWRFSSRVEISAQIPSRKKIQLYEKFEPRLKYNSFEKTENLEMKEERRLNRKSLNF